MLYKLTNIPLTIPCHLTMASFAKNLSLFILLITLTSSQARSVEFFNKDSANNDNNVNIPNKKEPQNNQPDFLPENENANAYGLYGRDSAQLPPSTTTTTTGGATVNSRPKYLPKNYNPVAYVTEPEDIADNNNYYNNNNQQEEEQEEEQREYKSYPTTANRRNNNKYYYYYYNGRGGSSFNSQPAGGSRSFHPQGMSDTRFLENGKYFYDINTEKYSSNHPYETLKAGVRERNENDQYNNYGNYYYGKSEINNNDNAYKFNQNNYQGEFQDEENYNLP